LRSYEGRGQHEELAPVIQILQRAQKRARGFGRTYNEKKGEPRES
jgi:hypothetical protein